MEYLTFTILSSILVIIIVILILKSRRDRILANRIPGPNGWFLIGMLPLFLQEPEKLIKNLLREYRMYEKFIIKFWLFNNLYIVLTRLEDIKLVLSNPKCLRKSKDYMVLQESIMGQGIFSIDDIEKWKNNRKIVIRGFSFSSINSFIPIFYQEANVLAEILQEKCILKSNECNISGPVSMATMEMIGKTALGVTFNAQTGGCNQFVEHLQTAMHAWEYRITHPWYLNNTLFRFSSVKRKHDQSQKIINEFTDEIIKKKIIEFTQKIDNIDIKIEKEDEDCCPKPKTVLEILLRSSHKMDHKQIRDEIVTVMIGGQETTTMAITCIIFMLAHHQDVQNKVFEELQSIFLNGDHNRTPTYRDFQQMKYVEMVIKETLRLFPPLPFLGRRLNEDIKIGEYMCPAGAALIICPIFLQSSPLYYTDSEKFNPDNFLPDVCGSRHSYAYIPFGAGFRNCIGIKYAMLQIKTVISTLVRKIKFFPSDRCPTPEDLRLMFLMTLKLVDGCYVKVEPRT
ncbi:cytochrome P450 4C1 isoform X3 [Melanaphis sacchari]|uniref:cytochrome P450 4C1 isoform X3 n=1 Tax=Melanaphis sacchari TaxID=742174 RepID=UPI000DC13AF5|nr:cytochrome P450 4C1 isoform X3 [Melanaphis sacchari]XP_025192989.1 cytochrome P450 4C1 isoform X3 [Melanaphis sacchari]